VYVNPKYADQYPAPTPPAEQGTTLASFDRNRGNERLRVSFEVFNNFPFVRLQVWNRNGQGEWWPAARTVTVKRNEIEQVVESLRRAQGMLGQGQDRQASGPARSASHDQGQGQRPTDRDDRPVRGFDGSVPYGHRQAEGAAAAHRAAASPQRAGEPSGMSYQDAVRPRYVDRRRHEPRTVNPADLAGPRGGGNGPFDEFC
jgi:hypothetical protein